MQDLSYHDADVAHLSLDHKDQAVVAKVGIGTVENAEVRQIGNRDAFVGMRHVVPDVLERAAVAPDDLDRREEGLHRPSALVVVVLGGGGDESLTIVWNPVQQIIRSKHCSGLPSNLMPLEVRFSILFVSR